LEEPLIFVAKEESDHITLKDLYFNSHAIVIGVSKYKESDWGLKNPVNDAKAIAQVLKEKYGFNNIQVILDKDATKQKLEETFADYIRGDIITDKDRLLVYYSGHGDIRSSSDQQGRKFEESFLIPYDATSGIFSSYVNMDTVTTNCGLCKAKHILLILDSCYSGSAFVETRGIREKPAKITDEYLKRIISKRTIQAVAATDKNQPADDSSNLNPNHGAFTGCLLDILNDDTDPDKDGILTASQVGEYLEKNVPRSRIPQNPISGHLPGSEAGEFIFNVFNVSKSQSTSIAAKVTELIAKGQSQFVTEDYGEAVRYYNEALSLDNTQAIAHIYRGDVFYKIGRVGAALLAYNKAIELDNKNGLYYYKKSVALKSLGRNKDGEDCYRQAISLDPKLGLDDEGHKDGPTRRLPPPTGLPPYHLSLSDVLSPKQISDIEKSGSISFHSVGCTGGIKNPVPQQQVADAMVSDLQNGKSTKPAFLYLLGDLVYFFGQPEEYYPQFYEPYSNYQGPIFAIPGNHDGDISQGSPVDSLSAFVRNFCDGIPSHSSEAGSSQRTTMMQPHVYWTLEAPFVTIIGLYSNVPEGGQFYQDQIDWLINELKTAPKDKAVIVTVHHSAYSLDMHHSGSQTISKTLDDAFSKSGRTADLVLSSHVNIYERFTRKLKDIQIPYVVAGTGGYHNLHIMGRQTDGSTIKTPYVSPYNKDVTLENYQVEHGYLIINITSDKLSGEFYTVPTTDKKNGGAAMVDSFKLDLKKHVLI